MDALAHFSIPVSGLQNGPHEYEFDIDGSFFHCFPESPIKEGSVSVQLLFDKSPDMYTMNFQLEGMVKVACDRCLEEFDLPIEADEMLLAKFDEKEWEDADIVYVLRDTPKFNVAKYIYEFIVLAVPMVKTHDDADEECDPEMLKFLSENEDTGREAPDKSSPIWDALKGLQNDN
ncbi:MAG: DUF177 domain-containing protein [Saprospiraceae bacterium]|jgi:uncharacterized metal-binding protein YceD (DUF177 family)|nr:DUF177 domain-containing protein [Saprospiraceae bacterium]